MIKRAWGNRHRAGMFHIRLRFWQELAVALLFFSPHYLFTLGG